MFTQVFELFGELDWLDPDEFYEGDWTIEGKAVSQEDGETYDIVWDAETGIYRFTTV